MDAASLQYLSTWQEALLACAIVLVLLAIINHVLARQAERRHPPAGLFMEVDGILAALQR